MVLLINLLRKNAICRSHINLHYLRPCDGNETSGVWIIALRNKHGPSVFSLSRQNLPQIPGSSIEGTLKGAYVIRESKGKPEAIIASTGSEVYLCVKAVEQLEKNLNKSIRIVSMPCWETFEEQPLEYRQEVFPPGVPVLSVEAQSVFGWERYAHASIGMRSFGLSGPYDKIYERFGFTPDNIANKTTQLIDFYHTRPVPHLLDRMDLQKDKY